MRLFLRTCKLCTLQYSVVRPTTALVTLALASAGQYREGDFSVGSAYVVSPRRVVFGCASSSPIVFVALLLGRIRVRRHLVRVAFVLA